MKILSLLKNLFSRPKKTLPAAQAHVESNSSGVLSMPAAAKSMAGYLGAPFPSQTKSLPMAPRSRSKGQLPSRFIRAILPARYAADILAHGGPKPSSRRDRRRAQAAEHIALAKRDVMNQPARYSQHTK